MLFADTAYNYNDLVKRIEISIKNIVESKKNNYVNLLSKLEVLNPITTLKRGYSVTRSSGKIITSVEDIQIGDTICTTVVNGKMESVVKNVSKED